MGRTHQLACSRRRSLLQFRTYEPSRTVDRSSIFIRFLRGLQTAPTVARCCRLFYGDRKSTRLNSSHSQISYAVFCLKKKKKSIITNKSNKKKKQKHTHNLHKQHG